MIEVSHVNVRMSISFMVARLIALYLTMTVISVLFMVGIEYLHTSLLLDFRFTMTLVLGGLHIIELILAIWLVLDWLCEYIEIHPDRIHHHHGIFFQQEHEILLRNITAFQCDEGVLGEMLNFGTIRLFDFANQKTITLPYLHNPKRCYDILKQLMPTSDSSLEHIAKPLVRDIDTKR